MASVSGVCQDGEDTLIETQLEALLKLAQAAKYTPVNGANAEEKARHYALSIAARDLVPEMIAEIRTLQELCRKAVLLFGDTEELARQCGEDALWDTRWINERFLPVWKELASVIPGKEVP